MIGEPGIEAQAVHQLDASMSFSISGELPAVPG
jgi:hypothetical protein